MLLVTSIDIIEIVQALIIVMYLYLRHLFLLIKGLFLVSAGAYKYKEMIEMILIKSLTNSGVVMTLQRKGPPINIVMEDIRHIKLVVACNPKPVFLNILKQINSINI